VIFLRISDEKWKNRPARREIFSERTKMSDDGEEKKEKRKNEKTGGF